MANIFELIILYCTYKLHTYVPGIYHILDMFGGGFNLTICRIT